MVLRAAKLSPWRMRPGIWIYLGWRLVKPGLRLIRRALGRDPLPAGALMRLWIQSWRGLIAYPAAQRVARERRMASPDSARESNMPMGRA